MTDTPDQLTTNQVIADYLVQLSAIEISISPSGKVSPRMDNAHSRAHARLFREATSGTQGLLISRLGELRAQSRSPIDKSATVAVSLWAKEEQTPMAGALIESDQDARRLVAEHAKGLSRLQQADVATIDLKLGSKNRAVRLVIECNFKRAQVDVSEREKDGQTRGSDLANKDMRARTPKSTTEKVRDERCRIVGVPDNELYERISALLASVNDRVRTTDIKEVEYATAGTTALFNSMAGMSMDQLSEFHSLIELAKQLKAAKTMLGDRQLTVANVNRLLRKTNEKFSNEDKENIVRLVAYFTERNRRLYIGKLKDRKPCELAAYPRGDSKTLAFCVKAEGEPPRKKATLAEGLSLS